MTTKKQIKNNGNRLSAISVFSIASLFSVSVAAVPLELEGPIESIVDFGDGTGSITVMGVTVDIPYGTSITTPTQSLSMSELGNTAPLPGRTQQGFYGGTAIIIGDSILGVKTADDIFVEPAENIVLGEINNLANTCSNATCDGPNDNFYISGTKMVPLTDSRILAGTPVNANGLAVDLSQTVDGSSAAAEGYYDGNGTFYYFALEAEGVLVTDGQTDIVSITRARCRDDDSIQVSGGILDADGIMSASVTIVDFGTAPVIQDPETFEYTYLFRSDIARACPGTVTVQYNSSFVEGDVDIR